MNSRPWYARSVGRHRAASAWLLAGSLLLFGGCAAPAAPRTDPVADPKPWTQTGQASWYSDALHGRRTASGERYDRTALTAAHRELPFGTRVRVVRPGTERSVVVRINDRGPFVEGRVIDLSRRAAEELGMIREGVVKVRVTVLEGS